MKKNLLSTLSAIIISTALISLCSQKTTSQNLIYLHQQTKSLNAFITTGDVILDFYADWCNPCKRMSPLIDAVAALMPQFTFIKINRDNFRDLAKSYNITSIPTLIFLRDGKEIGRYDGGPLTETKLQNLVSSVYNK